MPAATTVTATIAAGQSLSAGVDCSAGQIIRLLTPPEWTGANLTFQLSSDGTTFGDLVDLYGREVMIAVVPGSMLMLGDYTQFFKGTSFVKLRSGSRDFPVAQEQARSFVITLDTAPASVIT